MTTAKVTPSVDGNGEILVPFDLHSAIAELDKMLPVEVKNEIKCCGPISQHMTLGQWIRNNWGLWDSGKSKVSERLLDYFALRGISHPDGMSGWILGAYSSHLEGLEVTEPPLLEGDKLHRVKLRAAYRAFFQSLVDAARLEDFRGPRTALPQHWIGFSTGMSRIDVYVVLNQSKSISVELYFRGNGEDENKARFDAVLANRKVIEGDLGRQLIWDRLDGKRDSRIYISKECHFTGQTGDFEPLRDWALNEMKLLREKMFPQVRTILDSRRREVAATDLLHGPQSHVQD